MEAVELREGIKRLGGASKDRCSRGVSESMYDPVFFLKSYLQHKNKNLFDVSDDELLSLYEISEFATERFY